MTSPDYVELHAETLGDIAAFVRSGLPAPNSIDATEEYRGITLVLPEEDRKGVAAWATALLLTMQPDRKVAYWTCVEATAEGGVWRKWQRVSVWSACDLPDSRKTRS